MISLLEQYGEVHEGLVQWTEEPTWGPFVELRSKLRKLVVARDMRRAAMTYLVAHHNIPGEGSEEQARAVELDDRYLGNMIREHPDLAHYTASAVSDLIRVCRSALAEVTDGEDGRTINPEHFEHSPQG